MKILILLGGGRSGSDFFHSLTDGHSQILQFPGPRVTENLEFILNFKTPELIAKSFVKYNQEFFDSRVCKFERWDKLGSQKNKFFRVNKKKFIYNFVKIIKKNKNNSNLDILKNLHFAYFLTRNKKINNIKILLIHTHILPWTKKLIKLLDLKKFDIIYTIRHPLASISSSITAWLNYKNGSSYFSKNLYSHFNLTLNGLNDLQKLTKNKAYVVKLENLHTKNKQLMKNFSKKFKIQHQNCLSKSTKLGLKWWGDKVSKKWLSGVNQNYKININKEYFYKRDLSFFQFTASHIIQKYKYNFIFEKKRIYFNILPMKCELLIWKNTIKHLFTQGVRWKHLLSIPIFYILRIVLLNKIVINSKKNNLPKTILN